MSSPVADQRVVAQTSVDYGPELSAHRTCSVTSHSASDTTRRLSGSGSDNVLLTQTEPFAWLAKDPDAARLWVVSAQIPGWARVPGAATPPGGATITTSVLPWFHPSSLRSRRISSHPAFGVGLAAALVVVLVTGQFRTQSGPSWWEAALVVAALFGGAGVVVAAWNTAAHDGRKHPGFRRARAALLTVGILALIGGVVAAMAGVGAEQHGTPETFKGTLLAFGFIAIPISILVWLCTLGVGTQGDARSNGTSEAQRRILVGQAAVRDAVGWHERASFSPADICGMLIAAILFLGAPVIKLFQFCLEIFAGANSDEPAEGLTLGNGIVLFLVTASVVCLVVVLIRHIFGGRLPTPPEVEAFVADTNAERANLLHRIIAEGDVLSAFELIGHLEQLEETCTHNKIPVPTSNVSG